MRPTERRALDFRERMRGHVAFDDLTDLTDVGLDKTGWTPLGMRLQMHVPDVPRFWDEPDHRGESTGVIICPGLGGELPVHAGHFNLLVDGNDPGHKHMRYLMHFQDRTGRKVTLAGYKELVAGGYVDIWEETTLLFTRLHRGWLEPGEEWSADVIATGTLRIRLIDFLVQLTTFRPGPQDGLVDGLMAVMSFGPIFFAKLAQIYLLRRQPVPARQA